MDVVSEVTAAMPEGEKGRVARIVRAMGTRLRAFVRSRVATDFDADDVMQDVWERLITAFDGDTIEDAAAWLFKVARNRIIDRSRKKTPESLEDLRGADDGSGEDDSDFDRLLPADARTPASEFSRNQFWGQLSAALAELPPEQRQVFVWHELEALSFQDIAEITGENVNTLLSRKRYAILHLRKRLRGVRDEMLPPSEKQESP